MQMLHKLGIRQRGRVQRGLRKFDIGHRQLHSNYIPLRRHGVTMTIIDSNVYSARLSRNKNARPMCASCMKPHKSHNLVRTNPFYTSLQICSKPQLKRDLLAGNACKSLPQTMGAPFPSHWASNRWSQEKSLTRFNPPQWPLFVWIEWMSEAYDSPMIAKWIGEWTKRGFLLRKHPVNEEEIREAFACDRRKLNCGH